MQEQGMIVAMTGDAVNDAAALKQADIGVAMGSGSEVTKQAARMILTDDNFGTLVHAVELGRRVYAKIVSYVRYQMTQLLSLVMLFIAATVGEKGEIVHLNDRHGVTFGERDGTMSDRIKAIDQLMDGARFDHLASSNVLHEMWQKWVFLATLAGSTCLCRASIGDIAAAPGGRELVLGILAECQSIAAAAGYRLSDSYLETTRRLLTAPGSPFTASMLRDIEAGAPIEGDHIIGDLLARGDSPLLRIVYTALKAYEARREVKNERSG